MSLPLDPHVTSGCTIGVWEGQDRRWRRDPLGLKVGELAAQTGISIRTLHYYDEIGLLSPSQRTEAGYRLYTTMQRLQQILSLRRLGLASGRHSHLSGAEAIAAAHPGNAPGPVARTDGGTAAIVRPARGRFGAPAPGWRNDRRATTRNHTGESPCSRNTTPQNDLDYLKRRKEMVGDEPSTRWSRSGRRSWPRSAQMDQGTDPTSAPVLALARRWQGLVNEFTGGGPRGLIHPWAGCGRSKETTSPSSMEAVMIRTCSLTSARHWRH